MSFVYQVLSAPLCYTINTTHRSLSLSFCNWSNSGSASLLSSGRSRFVEGCPHSRLFRFEISDSHFRNERFVPYETVLGERGGLSVAGPQRQSRGREGGGNPGRWVGQKVRPSEQGAPRVTSEKREERRDSTNAALRLRERIRMSRNFAFSQTNSELSRQVSRSAPPLHERPWFWLAIRAPTLERLSPQVHTRSRARFHSLHLGERARKHVDSSNTDRPLSVRRVYRVRQANDATTRLALISPRVKVKYPLAEIVVENFGSGRNFKL